MRLDIAVLLAFFSFSLYAVDPDPQKIQQRLQSVGQLHIQEDKKTPAPPSAEDKETVKANEAGQKIYEQHCIICHRDGLAGAPKLQNEKDWRSRLSGRTLSDLVASSIKGLNAMPAKGTCVECNEQDLEAAIQYMLPKS